MWNLVLVVQKTSMTISEVVIATTQSTMIATTQHTMAATMEATIAARIVEPMEITMVTTEMTWC